jgi:hypothetical protein
MTRADGSQLSENAGSGTQLYAISVMLDAGWKTPRGTNDGAPVTCNVSWAWGIVFQLHGPDSYGASPAFALMASDTLNPGAKYTVSINAGMLGSNPNGARKSFNLSRNSLALGKWVDFIFQVHWAEDNSGWFNVWRRDQSETGFTLVGYAWGLATLQRMATSSGQPHYWKAGLYRPNTCSITNRLWIEGPARGSSLDAVRTALWDGAPVRTARP